MDVVQIYKPAQKAFQRRIAECGNSGGKTATMPLIISIIGRSGSGKTTLIEKLIRHFSVRGHKIATIKHMRHEFDIDRPGKDTWRYREAGAHAVIITNDRDFALMSRNDSALESEALAEKYFSEYDLVIIEGEKEGSAPKIEVIGDSHEPPLFRSGTLDVAAVVTDSPLSAGVPVFVRNDAEGVASFIETLLGLPK